MSVKVKSSIKVLAAVRDELAEKKDGSMQLAPAVDRIAVALGWHPGSVRTWIRTLVSSKYLRLDREGQVSMSDAGVQLLQKENQE